jgi:hypothetical protein
VRRPTRVANTTHWANGETDLDRKGVPIVRRLMTRFGVAVSVAAVVLSLGASAVFAGEITGTGTSLKIEDGKWGTGLHARSECAYSGQEDLQYPPFSDPNAGHAQSWGQIPLEFREYLTSIGFNPGIACNPTTSGGGE